jgi:hypothetical protein
VSAQPLPCLFCGAELQPNNNLADIYVHRYGTHYDHRSGPDGCILSGLEVSPGEIDDWNRRATITTKGGAL